MNNPDKERMAHLRACVARVRANLGLEPAASINGASCFADLLDSMGMVEFLTLLAEDLGVTPGAIEQCVGHEFGTLADLAAALDAAKLTQKTVAPRGAPHAGTSRPLSAKETWLAATAVRLPDAVESAELLNTALARPAGWLQRHAGIQQRRTWAGQDPLAAAAAAGCECLDRAGLSIKDVGVLLVTSEAPPLLTGLGAALHHRLELPGSTVALELGGACTGYLAAFWAAQRLLAEFDVVLVVAVEAPTRLLEIRPGPAGEAAALFGDASAASVLATRPTGREAVPLKSIWLGTDGTLRHLLHLERNESGAPEIQMTGVELAGRAVDTMAQAVTDLARLHGLGVADLTAVVAHGGNGRLPALLALKLSLPPERVKSETPRTGNLGSASLPVAWAALDPKPSGLVVWTAVGAGLTQGAALFGEASTRPQPAVSFS
jgi:3-oxoacyl-[acyl-carrier-protein] synthase-3